MTRSDKLPFLLTALAVLAISITNVSRANADLAPVCAAHERPWTCVQKDVIRETTRHPVVRHHITQPDLHALIAQLAAKVGEVMRLCGSQLISGYRPHAVIAGTHHPSLHSTFPARAADIRGNPSCAYGLLHNWSGGYSTDYARVRHIHISYSPPGSGYLAGHEWGRRFVHGGHRYAKHTRRHLRG